jgi:hypothetical protein
MQRIKLFESFSVSEYEIEKIYEKWDKKHQSIFYRLYNEINEQGNTEEPQNPQEPMDQAEPDWLEDETLTSGEMAALERDFQVITRPQLSALYLKALGQYEFGDPERLGGRRSKEESIQEDAYVTGIPGIEYFCTEDMRTGRLFIGTSALSDAIGLESLGTVTRTVNKFRLLLNGEMAGRHDEVVYKKIINAFNYLQGQPVDVIQNIAAEGIQDPKTSTKHRSLLRTSGISKTDAILLGKSVHSLFKDLLANVHFKKDVCKVQNIAINKISDSKKIPVAELLNYYKAYLMDQKMFDKFNWCDLYMRYH